MLADGLVRATDNAPDGSEAFFAQIRPANPGDGAWNVGYVQSRYLVMVSLFDTHAHIYGIISTEIVYIAGTECRGKIGYPAVV